MSDLHDRIERLSPDAVIPYANNAKEHPDEQVKKIASSIKNYGWDQPIVVDGDNEIIKGHGRLQAAELLGLDEVPVIRRDDLTDAEAKAARIADNKTAESPWNNDLLGTELALLEDQPIDMDTLGFDEDELDSVIGDVSLDDEDIAEAFGDVPDGERDDVRTKSFTVATDQIDDIERAIEQAKDREELSHPINDNMNGNAIAHVCNEYLGK